MARILIAGFGYIGTTLGEALTDAGHQVWGLSRNPADTSSGIKSIQADLTVPDSLASLPSALDVIFYTAGAKAFTESAYRDTYVTGIDNLLNALSAREGGTRRFIFTSSTGVYHQNNGETVDEESPTHPERFSGQCLLEGERLVAQAPLEGISVRLAGIYGPGRTRLLDAVRAGSARCTEGDTTCLNLIHRDDAVGILLHLMQLESSERLYLAADNQPIKKNALMHWLAEEVGAPPPPSVPAAGNHEPQRGGHKYCNNARLRASSYTFTYPSYQEGYRELL
jgi:nucleoside-diphosphate-sugar epimerase